MVGGEVGARSAKDAASNGQDGTGIFIELGVSSHKLHTVSTMLTGNDPLETVSVDLGGHLR